MELHGILTAALFGIFICFLVIIGIKNKKNRTSSKGISPINSKLFLLAKISLFIIWILTFLEAINFNILSNYSNDILSWISVLVIFLGVLILIIAFFSLGRYTKFGLPSEKTELITKGIYRFSRHPMYLGLLLLTFGSALYLSHWLIIVLSFETIFLHHKIVIAEEEFLALAFKEKWVEYKNKVNRYI